jgi:DNA polymerase bacteriophage-type
MQECVIDSETRSPEPISHGTDRYSDPAESIIWTFAVDNDKVTLWDRLSEGLEPGYVHPDLERIIADESITFVAHNASFDRAVMIKSLGRYTRTERWRCTRAQAYSHGLPGALEILPAVLGLPPSVAKFAADGHAGIHRFCIPYEISDGKPLYYDHRTHPGEWFDFCTYGIQDTVSLRAVRRALPTSNYQGHNLATWWLDQLINNRGFGFDPELAVAARALLERSKGKLAASVSSATGGAVETPTQRTKLLAWLEAKGFEIPNLRAATVREMLDADDLDPLVRFVLESRLEAAKASGAKYGRGFNMMGQGNRIRHAIQFSGAGRSGRFSHKGFQPGNMQRPVTNGAGKNAGKTIPVPAEFCLSVLVPGIIAGRVLDNPLLYDQPHSACANALRCAIVAAEGNELIETDYSGVEARGAAWLADETWLLEAYRAQDRGEGADSYKMLIVRFFGIPLEEVNNHLRQVGKVVRLSFQYGAGVGGLVTMAANYNMDLDALAAVILPMAKAEHLKKADKAWRKAFFAGQDFGLAPDTYRACDVLKQMYREAEKRVTQVRYDIDKAVHSAMENPGVAFTAARSTIFRTSSNLTIVLPSGRRLLYWSPQYISTKEIDPETLEETGRRVLTFKTPRGKSWVTEKAWNGLFFNNIDQGTCADIMRDGLRAVHADTLTVPRIAAYLATLPPQERTAIVLHVHDAITTDTPIGSYSVERQKRVICSASPWAVGFPLVAEGWAGPRYHYK